LETLQRNGTRHEPFDFYGPTLEFLTLPEEAENDFCVLRGVIPPGIAVPLHSHPDTETFFVISGEVLALKQGATGYDSIVARAGDYISVPAGARHAWRNVSSEPVVALMITTARLGRFFQEAGRPLARGSQPLTPADLMQLATLAVVYGHWNATPEENAAAGISL
jgi:quercetin dioxygenase-like cupin family protein